MNTLTMFSKLRFYTQRFAHKIKLCRENVKRINEKEKKILKLCRKPEAVKAYADITIPDDITISEVFNVNIPFKMSLQKFVLY